MYNASVFRDTSTVPTLFMILVCVEHFLTGKMHFCHSNILSLCTYNRSREHHFVSVHGIPRSYSWIAVSEIASLSVIWTGRYIVKGPYISKVFFLWPRCISTYYRNKYTFINSLFQHHMIQKYKFLTITLK